MPDQKLSAITEEATEFNDDDRIYLVQEEGSPVAPVSKYTQFSTLRDAIQGGGTVDPALNGWRAVLGTQVLNLAPQTPSGSDTSGETLTLPAAFATGTRFVSSATSGGLTAGTLYYARYLTSTTIAVFTSLANALADSSRVNITGTPSAVLTPSGIEAVEINFRAVRGNRISLQDGSGNWGEFSPASIAALAFGTVSSGDIRTLFLYNNGGTVTAEWGSAWSAATFVGLCPEDCEMVDGVPLKTGDHTRRCIAAFRANSITTTIIDTGGIIGQTGGKIFGSNWDNVESIVAEVFDGTASWSGVAASFRQLNGNAGNQIEFLLIRPQLVRASHTAAPAPVNTSTAAQIAIGLNATTPAAPGSKWAVATGASGNRIPMTALFRRMLPGGYHYLAALEYGNSAVTFYGRDGTNPSMDAEVTH